MENRPNRPLPEPIRGLQAKSPAKLRDGPPRDPLSRLAALVDSWIPAGLLEDTEMARRARMVTRFGLLGAIFGFVYAVFYLWIEHYRGAGIVVVCSLGVAASPAVMRLKNSVDAAGNFLAFILTVGFSALCLVEAGLRGHAIAWLVSIPLCALLLVGRRSGACWAVVSFVIAGAIAALDFSGVDLPATYDPKWNTLVSAFGYLGLILFMFLLGMVFETGRARAFAKMQEALAELAASNERLVHLNHEKNEFMCIAAHDLKNPLNVILGSAELLKDVVPGQNKSRRLADHVVQAAKRMRDLINNLLDANAIEQGRFVSNIERCDMSLLVDQCVENNRHPAAIKGIGIRLGITGNLWARADRAAALQILDNLISNAVKYSPPNTTIHVHALPEKDTILVSVRDEGPGISESDQKKMFRKFTRLSARPTGGETSTGLGLSIAKWLAEAMAGSVQCQSSPGLGSTFMMRLPIWPDNEAAPAATTSSETDQPVAAPRGALSPPLSRN